jgi:hypothetical protein
MSGNHIGRDNVNMYGGTGNTGIVHNQAAAPAGQADSEELAAAVRELITLLVALRDGVAPRDAQYIDEALPAIGAGPAVALEERHRVLRAVAGVAATVGVIGVPAFQAVQQVLALLGGQ